MAAQLADDAGGLTHFLGQVVDGLASLVHQHLALLAALGRLLGGGGCVLGVAGDLHGGARHLGDRGGDHGHLLLLTLQLFHRGLVGHQAALRIGIQLVGELADIADQLVLAADETVEAVGQLAHLVIGIDLDALGQIAVTVGDAGQGLGNLAKRAQQQADQPGDGDDAAHQHQQGQAELGHQQGGERRLQGGLVQHQHQLPVGVRDVRRPQQLVAAFVVKIDGEQAVAALALLDQGIGEIVVDLAGGLHRLGSIFIGYDGAVLVHQDGDTVRRQGHLGDILHQGGDGEVAADHAALGRLGQGHHHDVVGHVQVGFGHYHAALGHGFLIPATGAGIIAVTVDGRVRVVHLATALTEIGELETAGNLRLLQGVEGLGAGLVAKGLDDIATGGEPVTDAGGLLAAEALHLFLTALQQQGLLAAVALPGEQQDHQGEGDHHRQQYLLLE
ncbi:hypothetical protein D3C80_646570 [compost metagenome]